MAYNITITNTGTEPVEIVAVFDPLVENPTLAPFGERSQGVLQPGQSTVRFKYFPEEKLHVRPVSNPDKATSDHVFSLGKPRA